MQFPNIVGAMSAVRGKVTPGVHTAMQFSDVVGAMSAVTQEARPEQQIRVTSGRIYFDTDHYRTWWWSCSQPVRQGTSTPGGVPSRPLSASAARS